MISGILEEMTLDDLRELAPNLALIPIGSTEPHGSALPYGTDTWQVSHVAREATRRANQEGGRVVCLPTLPISLNNNFRAFPFACRMQVPTFMALLKDLVSLCESEGVRRIVFLNGHGGNPDVIRAVQRDLAALDGIHTFLIHTTSCASEEALAVWENQSDHAGEEETSQMLFLKPELVRKDKITNNPRHQPSIPALKEFPVDFVRPWHLYLPKSAGGDATRASAEKAEKVFASAITGTAKLLSELSMAPDSESFPY